METPGIPSLAGRLPVAALLGSVCWPLWP